MNHYGFEIIHLLFHVKQDLSTAINEQLTWKENVTSYGTDQGVLFLLTNKEQWASLLDEEWFESLGIKLPEVHSHRLKHCRTIDKPPTEGLFGSAMPWPDRWVPSKARNWVLCKTSYFICAYLQTKWSYLHLKLFNCHWVPASVLETEDWWQIRSRLLQTCQPDVSSSSRWYAIYRSRRHHAAHSTFL